MAHLTREQISEALDELRSALAERADELRRLDEDVRAVYLLSVSAGVVAAHSWLMDLLTSIAEGKPVDICATAILCPYPDIHSRDCDCMGMGGPR